MAPNQLAYQQLPFKPFDSLIESKQNQDTEYANKDELNRLNERLALLNAEKRKLSNIPDQTSNKKSCNSVIDEDNKNQKNCVSIDGKNASSVLKDVSEETIEAKPGTSEQNIIKEDSTLKKTDESNSSIKNSDPEVSIVPVESIYKELKISLLEFKNLLKKIDLRKEEDRLTTFEKGVWNNTSNIDDAAHYGFYYTGEGDSIACAYCPLQLDYWVEGDDVEIRHKKESPDCPFVSRKPVGNVPMPRREERIILNQIGRSANPVYVMMSARLNSFKNWPKSMPQTPQELAEAGFFYANQGDQTICFHCNGGLSEWEKDDKPWEQHALWFNRCAFLRASKGEEFIKNVIEKANTKMDLETKEDEDEVEEISQENNSSVKEDNKCKICYDGPLDIVFIPCGHVLACSKCAQHFDTCPICRQPCTLQKIAWNSD